jgi:N-ATPase, AtpR subunit
LMGFAYLAALGLNVRLYLEAEAGWLTLLIHITRLVATGAALTLCARQGALALLSSVAGFQMMKTFTINRRTVQYESKP